MLVVETILLVNACCSFYFLIRDRRVFANLERFQHSADIITDRLNTIENTIIQLFDCKLKNYGESNDH